ncbi:ribonuclease domain-containing protein [Commensalibacter nepenthis]|uniref:Ribonuclease domain-containing protein n=1 Tax=Commensalibacter nepenthis TaxID=3043872 RepID=A0ABT6Q644_9PROT|nr:ribonuclease domain-containing protein [Commensalibacter sp. TBRC 10068]MDI2111708.1 ribonuclease domain-containing protein [Commensalibacter sp. TBRC 10068]
MNGADIASTLQQYNWTFGGTGKILVNNSYNTALEAVGKIPSEAGKGAAQGAVVGAVAGEGVGAIPGAAAGTVKGTVSAIVSTIIGAVLDAVNQDNANEQAAANATKKKDQTSVSGGSSGGNITPPDDNDGDKSDKENTSNNPQAPKDPSQNTVDIPQKAKDVLNRADEKGSPFAGYKGGRTYDNDPSNPAAQKLPEQDANGNRISYKEWDTDPIPPKGSGIRRNADRIVTGSDGSAYYTNDHYNTFQKMR